MIDALKTRFRLSPQEAAIIALVMRLPDGARLHRDDTGISGNHFKVVLNHAHKRIGRKIVHNQWGVGFYVPAEAREWLKGALAEGSVTQ